MNSLLVAPKLRPDASFEEHPAFVHPRLDLAGSISQAQLECPSSVVNQFPHRKEHDEC